jgi:hypothetical protein
LLRLRAAQKIAHFLYNTIGSSSWSSCPVFLAQENKLIQKKGIFYTATESILSYGWEIWTLELQVKEITVKYRK